MSANPTGEKYIQQTKRVNSNQKNQFQMYGFSIQPSSQSRYNSNNDKKNNTRIFFMLVDLI